MQARHNKLHILAAAILSLWTLPAVAAPRLRLTKQAAGETRLLVPDLQGVSIAPLESKNKKGVVLFFVTNDCPIANACAPEIQRIAAEYGSRHVAFYLVYVDGSLSPADARKHYKDYGYTFPAVLDTAHKLVKRAKVSVTPEAAIFAPGEKLLYHGRIDDRAVSFGQVRAQPLKRDLREALDCLVAGKPVPAPGGKSIGCFISDLPHH